MVTASAAFKVLDQASDPIKKITDAGKIMDKSMESAGKALDKIDSPQVTQSLKTTEKNVKSLGNESTKAGAQIEQFTDKTNRNFTKMAVTGTAKIDELTRALKHFEHERATATLDVNIAKAEAKIRLIKHELRTFTTLQAQKELESLGLVAERATSALAGSGAGGGGGGSPGKLAGGLAGGFFSAGGRAAFMGAAILAALPAIVALTGAVSALIGSLGLAVGGAGAIGIGVLGAFVVGIGAIVGAVKPAITELKAVKDAQDKYNQSVQQYGRRSAQAVAAEKQLSAIRRKSPGASDVLRNAQVVSGRWKKSTAPARADVFGIMNEGLETVMANLPLFASITNKVMDSARDAVADFLKPFRGAEWHSIFQTLGDTFAAIEGPGMRAFANVLMWLGRVAQAASPVVVRMFEKLESWTAGLADRVSNRERTTQTVEHLVHALKEWATFGASAVKLMAAFFGAGADQGTSMVEGITKQFDEWTKWLHEHPQEMHDFFDRTIESAGKLVDALGNIARALGEIGDAMIPLLNMISGLVNLTGGNLAPLAVIGGARLALGKGFGMGKLFGGGAAAAGAGGAGAGVAGAAGAAGARGVAGTMRDVYGVSRAYGGSGFVGAMGGASRAGAAGSALLAGGKLAARGAAKFALPLTAGLAAWDFLSYQGNVLQRGQNALSGATFGLVPHPVSATNQRERGGQAAQQFLARGPGVGTIADRVATLQASLARRTDTFVGAGTAGPGSRGTRVGTHLAISGGERQRVQAQLDALKPVLHAEVQIKASKQGLSALEDLTKAFETRWHAAGSRAARKGLLHDIEQQMKELGPKGKRALLAGVADWTATLEGGNKRQRLAAQAAKDQIVSIYRSMGEAVAVVQGKIVALNATNWDKIASDVSSASNRAAFEASGAFTDIMNAAARALRLLGYSGGESKEIVAGLTQGGRAGRYAGNAVDMGAATLHGQKTKSQRIGDGHGWGDGGGNDEFGKHASQAAKTSTQVSKAAGFSGGLMGAKAGLGVYAQDAAGYGLHVTSGLRKGAITKSGNRSYHGSGDAIDVSGPAAAMLAFAKHAANSYGSRLEELIYTPMGFGIKNGKRIKSFGRAVDADHFDHVHMADTKPPGGNVLLGGGAGAGGVLGGSVAHARIAAPRSKAGGALGAASDRMYATIAAATQKKLNDTLDASGGAGAGGGGGAMSFNQVARLAESVGLPGIAFAQIAKGESGLNPMAVGHDPGGTQGLGLWQITTGYNDAIIKRFGGRQAMFNPRINAQAAKAVYDKQGVGAWYGTKYLTDPTAHFQGDGLGRQGTTSLDWGGWFGRGGEFTAHKPTLIGVGDGGSERVTIKPSGMASSTGRRPVEIHIDKLVNYEEGDIADILERELNKVADHLDKGVDDEDELT